MKKREILYPVIFAVICAGIAFAVAKFAPKKGEKTAVMKQSDSRPPQEVAKTEDDSYREPQEEEEENTSTYTPTGPLATDPNIFVNLAKRVLPSVVNISTVAEREAPRGGDRGFEEFWDFFFRGAPHGRGGGGQQRRAPRRAQAMGSGFIIDSSGLILTNNHVVDGADEIKIQFTEDDSEKLTSGEVVGRDALLDLALIRVKTDRKLVAMRLGDSDRLQVGEYVMAVGNPIGHGHTVTHGIISAKNRESPDFVLATYLQTDAPINPGNSGGPLVNLRGEVIGINNAIDARAQGIGFAIPISLVKKVLPQLKDEGKVSRGYIGVWVNQLTEGVAEQIDAPKDLKAPFVAHVSPGDPGDKAGLTPYDVILEIDGKKIGTSSDLVRTVTGIAVGKTVPMKILRSGEEKTLQIKIGERPQEQQISQNGKRPRPKKAPKEKVKTGLLLENINAQIRREFDLPKSAKGVIVSSLEFGTPADKAGLRRGDIVLEVNQKKVSSVNGFYALVKEKKSYLVRIERMTPGGQSVFSVVVLDLKETE